MNVLAVDQARNGGWAVYDYENKTLIDYGGFSVPDEIEYEYAIVEIKQFLNNIINKYKVTVIFIENIYYNAIRGISPFEKLAMLKGALKVFFIENGYCHIEIQPTQWQGYLNIKRRNKKTGQTKSTKEQSIEFCQKQFDVKLENDNIADAINIGWYGVNNIKIEREI